MNQENKFDSRLAAAQGGGVVCFTSAESVGPAAEPFHRSVDRLEDVVGEMEFPGDLGNIGGKRHSFATH